MLIGVININFNFIILYLHSHLKSDAAQRQGCSELVLLEPRLGGYQLNICSYCRLTQLNNKFKPEKTHMLSGTRAETQFCGRATCYICLGGIVPHVFLAGDHSTGKSQWNHWAPVWLKCMQQLAVTMHLNPEAHWAQFIGPCTSVLGWCMQI